MGRTQPWAIATSLIGFKIPAHQYTAHSKSAANQCILPSVEDCGDTHGNKVGHSDPTLFGSCQHRDASGKVIGHSDPGMFGGYRHTDSEGCYNPLR